MSILSWTDIFTEQLTPDKIIDQQHALRVNSHKNVTEGWLLTHLEMLPKECRLLFSCIGEVRVLPQPFQRLVDYLS